MDKLRPLPRKFYLPSAGEVAPLLLGHWLVRRTEAGLCGGPIVETEAYIEGDPACHAYRGETKRNRVMWGREGHSYVYLIYGFHFCFNAVCCPKGTAEAVLVRAVDPLFGVEAMQLRRGMSDSRKLTSGPGRLCSAIGIDRTMDGADLCDGNSGLFIAANPDREAFIEAQGPMITTTRIGLTKAADWQLRFYLDASRSISKPRRIRAGN